MKKVFLVEGKAQIKEVPIPETFQDWVLVRSSYSLISSGTERTTISNQAKGVAERFFEKITQNTQKIAHSILSDGLTSTIYQINGAAKKALECGYSCSGIVEWAGQNSGFAKDDLVACAGNGFACHAEFVAIPKNLVVKLKHETSLRAGSICALACIAMQGFRQSQCQLGETICIFGLGLIGLLTVQMAKIAGCKVIGIEPNQKRLKIAKELGCDQVFDSSDPSIESSINFLTNFNGVDSVILAAGGSSNLIDQALNLIKRRGRIVVVGNCSLNFERETFYQKEASVVASCSYGPGRYQENFELKGLDYPYEFVRWTERRNLELCAQLIESGQLKTESLIEQEFCVDKAQEAYEQIKNEDVLGIVISYKTTVDQDFVEAGKQNLERLGLKENFQIKKFNQGHKFNVCVVGTGGFAKTKLIPNILSIKNVNLYSFVDTNPSMLINAGAQFGVNRIQNSLKEALCDDEIDAVVISTPHGLHTDQAILAMQAGKAVFVEKPPATNLNQLKTLENFLDQNTSLAYAVDFNRSNSPFFNKISEAVSQRNSPLVIEYRVNAGFLAQNHWIFSPENNGRIIGEACHMFEFMISLCQSNVCSLSVGAISGNGELARDNFVANLVFDDGSIGTLIYTSLGHHEQEKERIEIFFEGRSIILTDFKKLTGYGMPFGFSKSSFMPEKGHKETLAQFFKNLETGNLFALKEAQNRALLATKISILINDLVLQGGGFINFKSEKEKGDKESLNFDKNRSETQI